MSLCETELDSPSSQEMVTSLQDVPITVPRSVVVAPQQTRSPTLSVRDWSPVIGVLQSLPGHHDGHTDSLAVLLKIYASIMKRRADCFDAFAYCRPVMSEITTGFEPQAGCDSQLVLTPTQKCSGRCDLFDCECWQDDIPMPDHSRYRQECRKIPVTVAHKSELRVQCGPTSRSKSGRRERKFGMRRQAGKSRLITEQRPIQRRAGVRKAPIPAQ
jgi:hypothetical protein